MKKILNPNYGLYHDNKTAFCDSLQIAETFRKRHYHVIRDIETLSCSNDFRATNFGCTFYHDSQGKKQRKYMLTKDGFVFLVMGYNGKKASEFKEAYINRFNQMADFIITLHEIKEDFPEFTTAVQLAHSESKPYHYTNEVNMLYSVVLNQSVQSFKKQNNIDCESIRNYLSAEQLTQFRALQRIDIGLLIAVKDFSKRKKILQEQLCIMRKNPLQQELPTHNAVKREVC